jgi:hypothetical protein
MRWYLLAVRAAATGTAEDRFGSNAVIGAPI